MLTREAPFFELYELFFAVRRHEPLQPKPAGSGSPNAQPLLGFGPPVRTCSATGGQRQAAPPEGEADAGQRGCTEPEQQDADGS